MLTAKPLKQGMLSRGVWMWDLQKLGRAELEKRRSGGWQVRARGESGGG